MPVKQLLAAMALLTGGAMAQNLPQGYAGSDTCAGCHEEISTAFKGNAHVRVDKKSRFKMENLACESCHGPGQEHVESGGDKTKIRLLKEAGRIEVNENCLKCHATSPTMRGHQIGQHYRASLSCTDCHSVHSAKGRKLINASNSTDQCSSCHTAARAQFNRPFRHRLQEGAIGCVDCHQPHGERPPAHLQRLAANSEPGCFRCHSDKRGPFPFEHAPVRLEPCSSCHEPHGSANPRMLTRHTVQQQCLECHAGTMNTMGGAPPAFHDLRSARFQNCTTCHQKIHGSYVSKGLLR